MELISEYKKEKCTICQNKNKRAEEDLCSISQFQYDGYQYCKCCNMTSDDKSIKRKI